MNALPSIQVPEPKPRPAPASQAPYAYELHTLQRWTYEYFHRCQETFQVQHAKVAEPISESEFRCLYELVSDEQEGNVLEIGTAAGFSTVALAGSTPWRTVHTVDPEQPYDLQAPPHQQVTEEVWELRRFIRDWLWNELGLENIRFHPLAAQEFDPAVCGLLGLLFIDGKHTRPDPFEDFMRFHRSVVSGGYIVFHDYGNPRNDVQQEVQRIRREYPEIWQCMELQVDRSLAVFKLIQEWPEFPPVPWSPT